MLEFFYSILFRFLVYTIPYFLVLLVIAVYLGFLELHDFYYEFLAYNFSLQAKRDNVRNCNNNKNNMNNNDNNNMNNINNNDNNNMNNNDNINDNPKKRINTKTITKNILSQQRHPLFLKK